MTVKCELVGATLKNENSQDVNMNLQDMFK